MSEKPEVRLIWEGPTTLHALQALVQARVNFELQLPPDYHFALFRHLFPHAAPGETETIDVSGTADLLDKVAEIQGLQELAELKAPVAASQAQLRILSPGPGILVYFQPQTAPGR
jgi:hypothetical protein